MFATVISFIRIARGMCFPVLFAYGRCAIVVAQIWSEFMEELTQTQAATIRSHKTVPLSAVENAGAAPVYEVRAGQQLGNYRVVRFLAEGGFAEVYLGEHIHLGTYAAIKVLKTRLTNADLKAFREEARTVARLRHTHIVSILDFDVQGEMPFLVMDYAPHGTLRQRHAKGTILPPTTILPYLTQLADGLQYAHNQHLVHRDVKPENMLLGWDDEILLSDFGIAVMLQTSRSEREHEVIGTITYMSPEQFKGRVLPASDQYSLGVVTYEWLCGQTPFQGSTTEIARQHVHSIPPSLTARNPRISPELERVVMRALAKDPEQRYPNIQAFVKAFKTASPQQTIVLSDSAVIEIDRNQMPMFTPLEATVFVPPTLPEFSQQAPRSKKRVTRRGVLLGISSVVGLGLTGGAIAWALKVDPRLLAQLLHTTPTPTPLPRTTPTQGPPTMGEVVLTYRGHTDIVSAAVWSPSNQDYIASASWDRTVHIWNTTNGTNAHTYSGHTDVVNAVAWSPDGQYVVSASNDRTAQVWVALQDGQLPAIYNSQYPQRHSSDHHRVALQNSQLPVIYGNHTDTVNAVAWSPDGKFIASGSNDMTVHVWTPQDGNDVVIYNRHTAPIRTVAWTPAVMGGQIIASAGIDKTVQIWDMTSDLMQPFVNFQLHTDTVNAVAWSPDGKYIASASADMTVQVWPGDSGNDPLIYKKHTAGVNAVAWSLDGSKIASGSDDGNVRVWDSATGRDVFVYKGHSSIPVNRVYGVRWSPDGNYIASAGADGMVHVWYCD